MQRIIKSDSEIEYHFRINSEEFILHTENGKPRVRNKVSGASCLVKRTVRQYIKYLNLSILLKRKNKNGEFVDLTTNELVCKVLSYYDFSSKDIVFQKKTKGKTKPKLDNQSKTSGEKNKYSSPNFENGKLVDFIPYSQPIDATSIIDIRNLLKNFELNESMHKIRRDLFDWSLFSINSNRIFLNSYNTYIRSNVDKKFGVYIFENPKTKELIYIGMAGKIDTDGSLGDHNLQNRLCAPRGVKDSIQLTASGKKKDIPTGLFLANIIEVYEIPELNIYTFSAGDKIVPAYIEAICLNEFYIHNNCLPRLNAKF